MGVEQEQEGVAERRVMLSRTTVLAFIAGIVIPLIAASVPPFIDYIRTASDFSYFRGDPVFFKDKLAYAIQVENNGRIVERSVEVWLVGSAGDLVIETDPFSGPSVQSISMRTEGNYRVALLGDMRPGDVGKLSILVTWKKLEYDANGALYSHPGFVEKIQSSERVAKFVPKKGTIWDREWSASRISWYASLLSLVGVLATFLSFNGSGSATPNRGR